MSGLILALALIAQDPSLIGLRVSAVHIEIEGRREPAADLRLLIETPVGRPLDAASARESIAQLFAVGRFDDVRLDAVKAGDGVELVYRLTPRHPVRRIVVRGSTGIAEATLREALEARFEGLATAPTPQDAAQAAITVLRDEGFLAARAASTADVRHAPHETALIFDVNAGPAAPIGEVTVEGTWPESKEQLLARVNARPGQPYRRSELRAALDRLVAEMRRAGRYAAAASHSSRPSADGTRIDVVIDADAGPVVEVSFEGDPMPRDRLQELVPIEREQAVDLDLLEDSTIRIVNALRREGYWRASAIYRTAETDGRLQVTFVITRGPRFRLGAIAIEGNRAISSEGLASLVDIRPGDVFLETSVARGAAAIREYYRRAGFTVADVKLDVTAAEDERVNARLTVTEGPQTFIREVTFTGVTAVGEADLRRRIQSRAGEPFYAPALPADREAIARAYLDRGYQQAAVEIEPRFDEPRTGVTLVMKVTEGPQTVVDRVIVVGNVRTDQQTILDEITLRQGGAFGLADIVESQRRLSALGFFRRVRIAEGPRQPGTNAVDVIITLEEAPATILGYGGGVEVYERPRFISENVREDQLVISPRGFFEVTRRNIGGRNSALSLFTRVSLGPDEAPGDPERDGRGFGISEYRLLGSYREIRAFQFDADVLLSASLEKAIRTTFSFNRRSLSSEVLKRLTPDVRVSGRYSLAYTTLSEQNITENQRLLIDRLFPQFRLSIFSGSILRDTRNDPVDPERGMLAGFDLDLAPRALGSEVGFIRTFSQAFYFKRLPTTRRLVFAGGARLGLAYGFPRLAEDPLDPSQLVEVRDLPASERFFAGGSTTVRGFQLDRLGVAEVFDTNGLSKGGNAMLVLNAELRLPVWKDVGGVAFVDAGNVFGDVADFAVAELRPTAGLGLRYRSPIGPLRVDLGFKLNRRRFGGRDEHGSEWHFSLGQAF